MSGVLGLFIDVAAKQRMLKIEISFHFFFKRPCADDQDYCQIEQCGKENNYSMCVGKYYAEAGRYPEGYLRQQRPECHIGKSGEQAFVFVPTENYQCVYQYDCSDVKPWQYVYKHKPLKVQSCDGQFHTERYYGKYQDVGFYLRLQFCFFRYRCKHAEYGNHSPHNDVRRPCGFGRNYHVENYAQYYRGHKYLVYFSLKKVDLLSDIYRRQRNLFVHSDVHGAVVVVVFFVKVTSAQRTIGKIVIYVDVTIFAVFHFCS